MNKIEQMTKAEFFEFAKKLNRKIEVGKNKINVDRFDLKKLNFQLAEDLIELAQNKKIENFEYVLLSKRENFGNLRVYYVDKHFLEKHDVKQLENNYNVLMHKINRYANMLNTLTNVMLKFEDYEKYTTFYIQTEKKLKRYNDNMNKAKEEFYNKKYLKDWLKALKISKQNKNDKKI